MSSGTGGTAGAAGGPGSGRGGAAGQNASGGAGGRSVVLIGDPPATKVVTATVDFDLLPDSAEFTTFVVEGTRVQIIPVDMKNWPPGFDWTNAPGKDAELNSKMQWARARLRAPLKTWYYDVTITLCGESDGESPFALVVNGMPVGTVVAKPSTDTTCGIQVAKLERVGLQAGDDIQLWGKPHSNLIHTEAPGPRRFTPTYAWARGRWTQLEFAATPGVQ